MDEREFQTQKEEWQAPELEELLLSQTRSGAAAFVETMTDVGSLS